MHAVRARLVLSRIAGALRIVRPSFLDGADDLDRDFLSDFRGGGLRWLFYASFAGIFISLVFIGVDSLNLLESSAVTILRATVIGILLLFCLGVVTYRDLLLSYYNWIVTAVLVAVLVFVAVIVGTPGVVDVADGFSSGPLLMFCLFLLYGFVRLPLLILFGVAVVFSASILLLEGQWSSGPAYHRLVLYVGSCNAFGAVLAFFIHDREYLLFRERRTLALSREGLRQRAVELQLSRDETKRLVRAVDHDLKQPLFAADVGLALLRTSLDRSDLTAARRYLADLDGVLAFLRAATNDMVRAAVSDGHEVAEIDNVFIPVVMREVIGICEPLAASEGVVLKLRVSDRVQYGQTNRAALSRILVNLVTNALKFSRVSDGRLRCVLVIARRVADHIVVSVYDRGPGIASEHLEKIWHPFYRGDASESVAGSGLGLYLVKRLISTLSNHSIFVTSEVGRGSRFSLSFRVLGETLATYASRGPDDLGAEIAEIAGIAGAYVVVVLLEDGDPFGLQGLLAEWGVEVDFIQGLEGLAAARSEIERQVDTLLIVGGKLSGSRVTSTVRDFLAAFVNSFPVCWISTGDWGSSADSSGGEDVVLLTRDDFPDKVREAIREGFTGNLAKERGA
jgi:signal transduction histidine kinase